MIHPAPIVRASGFGPGRKAAGVGRYRPEAMIERLNDPDKVVRMTANDGLKERTRRDFGFVAWAPAEERADAVESLESLVGGSSGPSRLSKRRQFA